MSVKLRLAAIAALSIATLAIISTFFYLNFGVVVGMCQCTFNST